MIDEDFTNAVIKEKNSTLFFIPSIQTLILLRTKVYNQLEIDDIACINKYIEGFKRQHQIPGEKQ